MLLIPKKRPAPGGLRARARRTLLGLGCVAALLGSGCLDDRATYEVDHMPDCMLGCEERCLSQHVGACQMACEDSWSWSLGLTLPICGFEWEAVDDHCRGPGAGCLEVYGPKLGTSAAADERCAESISTWETCMEGSYVLDCRWQCQASCDAEGLAACEGACDGNWSWIDRLGSGLCLSKRHAVDVACGAERECSAEGPIFSTSALTDTCKEALSDWTTCYEALN